MAVSFEALLARSPLIPFSSFVVVVLSNRPTERWYQVHKKPMWFRARNLLWVTIKKRTHSRMTLRFTQPYLCTHILLSTHAYVLQQDFLGMTDRMEGRSINVLAALAVANETALESRDRFAYFRRWSDDYVGVRTAGIQVGVSYTSPTARISLVCM